MDSSDVQCAQKGGARMRTEAGRMTRDGSTSSSACSQKTDCSDNESRNHEQTSGETGVLRQHQRMGEKRSVGPGADTPDKITCLHTKRVSLGICNARRGAGGKRNNGPQ